MSALDGPFNQPYFEVKSNWVVCKILTQNFKTPKPTRKAQPDTPKSKFIHCISLYQNRTSNLANLEKILTQANCISLQACYNLIKFSRCDISSTKILLKLKILCNVKSNFFLLCKIWHLKKDVISDPFICNSKIIER